MKKKITKLYKAPFPIVLVYATDWNSYSYQKDLDEEFNLCPGWVCGHLVKENREKIVIAQDYFPTLEAVRGTMVIPKSTIIFRKIIAKKGQEV